MHLTNLHIISTGQEMFLENLRNFKMSWLPYFQPICIQVFTVMFEIFYSFFWDWVNTVLWSSSLKMFTTSKFPLPLGGSFESGVLAMRQVGDRGSSSVAGKTNGPGSLPAEGDRGSEVIWYRRPGDFRRWRSWIYKVIINLPPMVSALECAVYHQLVNGGLLASAHADWQWGCGILRSLPLPACRHLPFCFLILPFSGKVLEV